MENPFFRNYWNTSRPRYSPSTRGVPLHRQTKSPSPKVVSIPVHFVGSEKARSAVALKIQKVFRGFLVRKSMKKIVGIKGEVEEIERRVSQSEMLDLIRIDAKERLKVNEMLMALLLRLDSVRGVDLGVRECRKVVIRKTIMLQEKVDAIVSGGDQTQEAVDGGETAEKALEMVDRVDSSGKCEHVAEAIDQILEIKENFEIADSATDRTLEMHDLVESKHNSGDCAVVIEAEKQILDLQGGSVQSITGDCDTTDETLEKSNSLAQFEGNSETKVDNAYHTPKETLVNDEPTLVETENLKESPEKSQNSVEGEGEEEEEEEEDVKESTEECQTLVEEENEMEIQQQPDLIQANQAADSLAVEESNREKKRDNSRDLMERMIGENEKLMGLVTQLCERNAMQTQMLSSLSQRVENLERAFTSEKLRRKKKRLAAGTVDKLENTPTGKKCERKS